MHMLKPKIEHFTESVMMGLSSQMTLNNDVTPALWQSFGPFVKSVPNRTNNFLYSINIYPASFSNEAMDPDVCFTKWAAVKVEASSKLSNLKSLILPAGDYAIFKYKGFISDFHLFIAQVYNEWLPSSGYNLDNRPHFEVLTPGYKPEDKDHEEEIWIPIEKL